MSMEKVESAIREVSRALGVAYDLVSDVSSAEWNAREDAREDGYEDRLPGRDVAPEIGRAILDAIDEVARLEREWNWFR